MNQQMKQENQGGKATNGSWDLMVLIFVLKRITEEERACSAPEIAKLMQENVGSEFSERTVRRKLDWILKAQAPTTKEEKRLADILYITMGGRILVTDAKTTRERGKDRNVKNAQKRYYFDPCMDDASISMINGTVISNSFLSPEEKDYLLNRLRFINQGDGFLDIDDEEDSYPMISDIPREYESESFPGESSVYIRNIAVIDKAIRKELQIEMTYGIYDIQDGQLDYHKRQDEKGDKIYRLNPYALHWCNGHYYLLATYVTGSQAPYMKMDDAPLNFRVDRIMDVTFGREIPSLEISNFAQGDLKEPTPRERIPKRLKKEFFHMNMQGDMVFDSQKYAHTFPNMRISKEWEEIEFHVECTSWSLQILVDAFGSTFRVQNSPISHTKDEVDYNGRPQVFLEAIIEGVDFENAKNFCLANPINITPLGPKELVDAVKQG